MLKLALTNEQHAFNLELFLFGALVFPNWKMRK